jgi:hypothetical protein
MRQTIPLSLSPPLPGRSGRGDLMSQVVYAVGILVTGQSGLGSLSTVVR